MTVIINNAQIKNMQIGPTIATRGLVSYWDVASTHSYPRTGSVWYDLVANQNNGSMVNMSESNFLEDSSGASFTLDGTDEYITIPSDDSLNFGDGSFSVILWIKIPDGALLTGAEGSYIVGKRGVGPMGGAAGWQIKMRQVNATQWVFTNVTGIDDGTTKQAIELAAFRLVDIWYMISFKYNSVDKELWLYVNDEPVGSRSFVSSIGSISNYLPLEILGSKYYNGTFQDSFTDITAASISSLAIHNTYLTTEDIISTYLATRDKHLNV